MLIYPRTSLLIDPNPDELVAALDQAAGHAGLPGRGRRQWRALLAEIAGRPEGRSQREQPRPDQYGALYVSAAWWTDHQGRKHVRVAAGDSAAPDWHPGWSRLENDPRPAVWHVYPERIFRVTRPEREPAWVASCACGATGEPRALGWMGPCCGPCHDRAEEGHPAEQAPALFPTGYQVIYAVTWAPDGRRLAVASSYRCVELLPLDGTPSRRVFGDQDAGEEDEFRTLVFSRDGRFLAAADPDEGSVLVWDLAADGHVRRPGEQELFFDGVMFIGLAFSPTEDLLVGCNYAGALVAWRLQEDGVWKQVHASRSRQEVTALTFAPDGGMLALGLKRSIVECKEPSTWKRRRRFGTSGKPGEDVVFLHGGPSAEQLVLLTACQARNQGFDSNPVLHLLDIVGRCKDGSTHFPFRIEAVAASPDGRYLAWTAEDQRRSPGEVTVWDVERRQEAGWLEWDLQDSPRVLAFSPDGQTLVSGSSSGVVKLWPWRRLLAV
jgi:hypothetical protein